MVALPIARVMRSGSGYFIFDPEFIPPCLRIPASERLMSVLGRLIEILEEKGASLALPKKQGGAQAAFSTREIANFWFLHTVNSSLAPLRHLYLSKRGHPEELVSGDAAAGRSALHVRARFASAVVAALRSRPSGRLLRRPSTTHIRNASRADRSDQLHLDSAASSQEIIFISEKSPTAGVWAARDGFSHALEAGRGGADGQGRRSSSKSARSNSCRNWSSALFPACN